MNNLIEQSPVAVATPKSEELPPRMPHQTPFAAERRHPIFSIEEKKNKATAKKMSWWKRLCVPPRIQAFEFCDQSWLKGVWRETYLDGLNFLFRLTGVYRQTYRPYAKWAQAAGGKKVLDLACGGAAHIADLLQNAQKNGVATPQIILSDLFPDADAFRKVKDAFPEHVDFIAAPVTAADTAAHDIRLLSIFGAFHHFAPQTAKKVLHNAARNADGLFVMEVFNRNWLAPFLSLPNFPLLLVAPFFSKRFSWKKLLLGTLLPIVPLMVVFDGTISALRGYRQEEFMALLPEEAKRDWHWEFGRLRCLGIFRAPYVFGFRRKRRTGFQPV